MGKELYYKSGLLGFSENQGNLEKLSKFFDKEDSILASKKILETLQYIHQLANKSKYSENPFKKRTFENATINLHFEDKVLTYFENEDKILNEKFGDFRNYDVRDINLSTRTINSLRNAGFYTLGDLLNTDIFNIEGIGKKGKSELREVINDCLPQEVASKYFKKKYE